MARIFVLIAFAAAVIALIWQWKTIAELRAEAAGLRQDLKASLDLALENPAAPSSEAGQAVREKLELIKLRHEVRELKEGMVESHARERAANLRSVARLFLPASSGSGPFNIRPEWKGMEAHATNAYAQAMQALNSATNDYVRFLNMNRACRMSLAVGRTADARRLATDMLVLDDKYSRGVPENANGDVMHGGHVVLGTIALDEGRIEEAKGHLLTAGKTRGSPVLGSFGPNMSLAKDLLEKGEQQTVLEYFELCRKFWSLSGAELDNWTKDIHAGRIPEFGGSLLH